MGKEKSRSIVTSTFSLEIIQVPQQQHHKQTEIPDAVGLHINLIQEPTQRQTTKDDKGNIQTSVYGAGYLLTGPHEMS